MDVAAVHLDPLRGQPGDLDRLEAPVSVFHGRGAFVAPGDVADGRQQGDPVRLDLGDHRIPTPRARFVGAVRDIYARLEEPPHQEGPRRDGLEDVRYALVDPADHRGNHRSEEHTSELYSRL